MSDIELMPLSQADLGLMVPLMNDEEQAWLRELDWDYAPIRRILFSFLEARILPGFLAIGGTKPLGYIYFLISRAKGMVGTVYVNPPDAQGTADRILSRAIESLKDLRSLRRIEAQIIPLGGLDLTTIFSHHGFQCYLRHYLELDLTTGSWPGIDYPGTIVPWHARYLRSAAEVAFRSYQGGIDAVICEDYGTEVNCEGYLRSLAENPGCGIFLPDSSFVGLNPQGAPCGFILTSRLSRNSAMIPQISIHPDYQGKGLGSALVHLALHRLASAGFRAVRLTVTQQNRRAYEWYVRLGFKVRRNFDAYVWQRQ
jgi:ribosomal protein S18 acetylase RimI-like enzyme